MLVDRLCEMKDLGSPQGPRKVEQAPVLTKEAQRKQKKKARTNEAYLYEITSLKPAPNEDSRKRDRVSGISVKNKLRGLIGVMERKERACNRS